MSKAYIQRQVTLHKVPNSPCNILSEPSKMPCPTFSLPAKLSCPFKVMKPSASGADAICSDCYACKGFYKVFESSIVPRQVSRFDWSRKHKSEFIRHTVDAIKATKTEYFRGHDSGDFYSPKYVSAWVEICAQLPNVRFWFPTRAWQYGESAPGKLNERMLSALRQLAALPNVTIRPSALYFGDSAPIVPGLHAGSTADNAEGFQCIAPNQDGECRECRVCWNDKTTPVSYHRH